MSMRSHIKQLFFWALAGSRALRLYPHASKDFEPRFTTAFWSLPAALVGVMGMALLSLAHQPLGSLPCLLAWLLLGVPYLLAWLVFHLGLFAIMFYGLREPIYPRYFAASNWMLPWQLLLGLFIYWGLNKDGVTAWLLLGLGLIWWVVAQYLLIRAVFLVNQQLALGVSILQIFLLDKFNLLFRMMF